MPRPADIPTVAKRSSQVPVNPWRPEVETFESPTPVVWATSLPDLAGITALPLHYSWRKHPARPPVSDQLMMFNTCIAHAACRMLETYLATGGKRVRLDADQFHLCVVGLPRDMPIPSVSAALRAMRDMGVPGANGFTAGDACRGAAPVAHLPSYRRLKNTDEIKRALAEVGPVIAVIDIGPAFYNLAGDAIYQGEAGGAIGSHAVLLIGFDDVADGGRWEAQNSFGTAWNGDGFVRIAYGAASILADDRHSAFCIA